MFNGACLCRKWVALEHGLGRPQCAGRWPNAGPMAQCGADGQWPRVAGSRRHRARECPGRRLGAAGLGQSLLGPRWAAHTLCSHVFEAGFCAENPTKEHICKNKQLLHFKSINQIPPFNKAARPAGAAGAAPKRKLQTAK